MLQSEPFTAVDSLRQSIRDNYRIEDAVVLKQLVVEATLEDAVTQRIRSQATDLIERIRAMQKGSSGIDALLNEFSLSSEEGVVLMCLAEALLRVPDTLTADHLIRDKLLEGDWEAHLGTSTSLFVNASAWGLLLTGKVLQYHDEPLDQRFGLLKQTVGRLGEPAVRAAMRLAMKIMGTQFVLGRSISEAIERAGSEEARGYLFSYDMLGEAACTQEDADRYFLRYQQAIRAIGEAAAGRGPQASPGVSVKLSAIHPRYEFSQRDRLLRELAPRLLELALLAREYDIGLTVDAEEADRLDLSLDIIERVFSDPRLRGWQGFGLAIQAYQKRALAVVEWVHQLAQRVGRRIMVRLVKGAYWDSEIKWSQVDGLKDYPVFTRKCATDVCYQACAKRLLDYRDWLYPQFATHNAYTVAAVLQMDQLDPGRLAKGYEFQRLHGMGEALYEQIVESMDIGCRVYGPVGEHADLLAYLVRRLLENGANSSFVNNIVDSAVPVADLVENPLTEIYRSGSMRHGNIPLPVDLYGSQRRNSAGLDLTDVNELIPLQERLGRWFERHQHQLAETASNACSADADRVAVLNPADHSQTVAYLCYADSLDVEQALSQADAAVHHWSSTTALARRKLLEALANELEKNLDTLVGYCVKEAGKTIVDAVSEIREAVDYCRYYALQALQLSEQSMQARGVILCISPWNFPLAIFLGQVSAALAAGNTVLAKPAQQTSAIAQYVVTLMWAVGFPRATIQLLIAPGRPVGEQLLPDKRIQGVLFTGSTATGHWLAQAVARRDDDIPLVAETGGQNVMIVDSTALPEQVVEDVVSSGFLSAGQRCSALRVLFVQEEVADKIIAMIKGAMAQLSIGDPALLSIDIGPVIDSVAVQSLQSHVDGLKDCATLHYRNELADDTKGGCFFAPHLYEISHMSLLPEEVFGPVVHVIRYQAAQLDKVVEQINGSGYGLTLGIHSRIQQMAASIAERVRVGNVYINRNMIGAVVGVQPFGGRGLSGTGPKAGGPYYLRRLVKTSQGRDSVAVGEVDALRLMDSAKVLPMEASSKLVADTSISVSGMREVSMVWYKRPIEQRITILESLKDCLSRADGEIGEPALDLMFTGVITLARDLFDTPQVLPGPTGERNRLQLEPRGVVLLLALEPEPGSASVQALLACLLSANAVVVLCSPQQNQNQWRELIAELVRHGLPKELIELRSTGDSAVEIIEPLQCSSLLIELEFDALLCARPTPALRQAIACRQGALVPVIAFDAADVLLDLCVEKTVTINTTAAGGNASLMAQS